MASKDWNHDGEKNFKDDLIEYQFYEESSSNNNYIPHTGSGISTFGAAVATIGGFFLAATILSLLGVAEDTPVLITLILWIICSTGLTVWFDSVGF